MHKRKSSLIIFLLSCCGFGLFGQETTETTRQDSFKFENVMIIPFDEGMYFSDCDRELAKSNKMTPYEVMVAFRYGMSGSVNTTIFGGTRKTRQLLNDTARTAAYDLARIYKSIGYKMEKPVGMISNQQQHEVESGAPKPVFGKLFGKGQNTVNADNSEGQDEDKIGVYSSGDRKFLNAKIHDVRMLEYLHKQYKTDLFVFLNQFEIITNYEHCLDRATNNFERTVKVHYSVYDVTGKQIAGDAAIVNFGSNSNSVYKIIDSNFPKVSAEIVQELPGIKKVRATEVEVGIIEDEAAAN